MSTATANGRPQRKQLSDQLDRLDGILDVLAEGLPNEIGNAIREGTRTALRDVFAEMLADPIVVGHLRQIIAPPALLVPEVISTPIPAEVPTVVPVETRPTVRAHCKAAFLGTTTGVRRTVGAAVRTLVSPLTDGLRALRMLTPGLDLGRSIRRAVIVALLVGGAVAVLALVSHPLAAVLSAVGAALTAFALQTAVGVHRLVRNMLG